MIDKTRNLQLEYINKVNNATAGISVGYLIQNKNGAAVMRLSWRDCGIFYAKTHKRS